MGFAKPKYGNASSFAKSQSLKEGVNDVRILPPMFSFETDGIWAAYHGTHFGFKGTNPRDPSKPSLRTFKCVEEKDWKTKMIKQDCPACNMIYDNEEKLKRAEAVAVAEKRSKDEIKEIVKPLTDWLHEYNVDRKWHLNVKFADGTYGQLRISHKTKKLLDALITRVRDSDGIDGIDAEQGVIFRFTRSGKGTETQDIVEVVEEAVRDAASGKVSRTIKLAPLSEADYQQALKSCSDLKSCVREIPYQQIKMLAECSGDPAEVDEILALGSKSKTESSPEPVRETVRETASPEPQRVAQPSAADDEIAKLKALLAQAEQKVLSSTPASTPASTPSESAKPAHVPAPSVAGLDRATFMSRFKGNKDA